MTTPSLEKQSARKNKSRPLSWWERLLEQLASTRLDRVLLPISRGRMRIS